MRLLFCGALLVLGGCGGKSGPELPVSGTLTLDGKPIGDVTVRFFPDTGTDPSSGGYAVTGTDGKFVVTNGADKKGLVAGKYKVTVSKGQGKQAGSSEDGAGAMVEGDLKDEFPPHYSNLAQTILSYSVTGDGKPIEIQLDSKKKK